jgi:hypothetical protein
MSKSSYGRKSMGYVKIPVDQDHYKLLQVKPTVRQCVSMFCFQNDQYLLPTWSKLVFYCYFDQATKDEIRIAYRSMATIFHPDKVFFIVSKVFIYLLVYSFESHELYFFPFCSFNST